MEILSRISHMLGIISMIGVLLVLSDLSRRLGQVRQMKDYWKLYYVAIFSSVLFFVMRFTESTPEQVVYRITALLVFMAGLVCAVVATVFYWGWLWRKSFKSGGG